MTFRSVFTSSCSLVVALAALGAVHCAHKVNVGFDLEPVADEAGVAPAPPATTMVFAANEAGAPDGGVPGVGFQFLVTETPPNSNPQTLWLGIARYDVASDGAPATPAAEINKTSVADPAGLAFRKESAELFVGNRHGNMAADGIPGSITRFLYDAKTKTFTANGQITGNQLNGVHQVTFNPVNGECFAANAASGISRFTFDKTGNAIPNGVLGTDSMRGLAVSADGHRLYATTAGDIIEQFDLTTGTRLPDVVVASNAALHFMAIFGSDLYVPGIFANRVFRFAIGPADELTLKDSIPGDEPISVAFSPDGLEMFVAGHLASSTIGRFSYDKTTDKWNSTTTINGPSSMGTLLVFASDAVPTHVN